MWCTLPSPPHPKSEVSTTTKFLCTGGYSTVRQLLPWQPGETETDVSSLLPILFFYVCLGFSFFCIWEEGWADTIYSTTSHQVRVKTVFNKTENITKPSCNILRNFKRFLVCVFLRESIFWPCYCLSEAKRSCFFYPPGCNYDFIGDKNRPYVPYYRSEHTALSPEKRRVL